jgi:hypothetical protein
MPAKTIEPKPPDWGNPENLEAYSWCINHGITIGCLACTSGSRNRDWDIQITVDGKKQMSPKSYGPDELYDKVFELYKFYYNKYNK